jgi:hypothetical protein
MAAGDLIPTPPHAYPLLTLAGTAWLLLVVVVVVELHRARKRRRGGEGGNSELPSQARPPEGHGALRLTCLTPPCR